DHLPDTVKQWPAIMYSQTGGQANNTNCDTDYCPRIQVDVFADSPSARALLVAEVQAALKNLPNNAAVPQMAPMNNYDFTLKKYQATLDYLVF
uniref:DUF3168 domain-containing protein n=1 Tax=Snodgrassella sp. CFCC 13594 TaxID=1775559 RepID=UPI000A627492